MKSEEESKALIALLEDAGFETRSYSGRAMYGKECVAISGEDVSAWDVARALWFNNLDEEDMDVPEPRQDQMGLGIVLYWPSYPWPQ